MCFCYIDGEFRYVDDETEADAAEWVEEECESGRCSICGKPMDFDEESDKFTDLVTGVPMPVNVCFDCAKRAYENGELD